MRLTIRESEKIVSAFKESIEDFGVSRVAPELVRAVGDEEKSKAESTLRRELNCNDALAKFGLIDAVNAALITGDMRPWKRIADCLGCLLVEAPRPGGAGRYAEAIRETGQMLTAIADALGDGEISKEEAERIERECFEAMCAIEGFRQALRKRGKGRAA